MGRAGAGKGTGGSVMEIRPNKEIAWKFDTARYATDAQVIGKDRVLLAEYLDRKISERDLKGNILWQKQCEVPLACTRLPNGATFVATRRQLLILDKDGKETFTHTVQGSNIYAAARARDGHMVYIDQRGQCTWINAKGNQVKSFPVGQLFTLAGTIEVLPAHRILVPLLREGKVVEFDKDGNRVWQATVPTPYSAIRLPNGNTVVANVQRVLELDRDGKAVWSFQPDTGRPFRLRRR
jgi:outer membrane protein assembly factor BamB